jgi:hypothetical protein
VGVVVGQPTSNLPPNRVIPSSHRRLGTYPSGFYHFGNQIKVNRCEYLPILTLATVQNPKNRIDLKTPNNKFEFLLFYLVLCLLSFQLHYLD